jgi:hypothetical protein
MINAASPPTEAATMNRVSEFAAEGVVVVEVGKGAADVEAELLGELLGVSVG